VFVILSFTRMTYEKTTRELVYETNRDVKWICRTLARMEAQDEAFEVRLRALKGVAGAGSRRAKMTSLPDDTVRSLQ